MSVSYNRINWENKPSTATKLNATNLNKMDKGIDDLVKALDLICPRVIITETTGETVSAVKGGTTIEATETSTGIYEVALDDFGTWTISSTSGSSATIDVKANEIYNVNLSQSVPTGSTVTPTDDVEILLNCANIFGKGYKTIEQLLNDSMAISNVLASSNAVDYLIRSKTFAFAITSNELAMTLIGNINATANSFIADSEWLTYILNSEFVDLVMNIKVPVMTSNTTPSGVVSGSTKWNENYEYYKAFNGNPKNGGWASANRSDTDQWIDYEFPSATVIKACKWTNRNDNANPDLIQPPKHYKIQASNDGTNYTDLTEVLTNDSAIRGVTHQIVLTNDTAYTHYRIFAFDNIPSSDPNTSFIYIGYAQFYGRSNV